MIDARIIFGGQFGSEAKRLFTEYYANQWEPDAIITNALPNSGGFDSNGVKWSTLPIGYPCKIMISPGSAIDMEHLLAEMKNLPDGAQVIIHPNAAVVMKKHLASEADFVRIGSTMTGGAEAVINKMRRDPLVPITAKGLFETGLYPELGPLLTDKEGWLNHILSCGKILLICAQGHSLSINHGFYPYCTSRNTSPQQVLADAGIPCHYLTRVIGCFRTFPIRVSNRYDEDNNMIGFSGPCYDDQEEITWGDVGVPQEYTSVSKKVRRVFTFSHEQLAESVFMNGATDIFLNFVNYLQEDEREDFMEAVRSTLTEVAQTTGIEARLTFVGNGPTKEDIIEM